MDCGSDAACSDDSLKAPSCAADEQEILIQAARESIVAAIHGQPTPPQTPDFLPDRLRQPAATFVTLRLKGKLRGCVGNLIARDPLYYSVTNNAAGAALRDSRFGPVTLDEVLVLKIHISVLSPLIPVQFSSPEELLSQLNPGKDGVVLRRSGQVATYLPQVWSTITDKQTFLESLSQKAGLKAQAWTERDAEILLYRVFEFGEAEDV